MRTVDPGSRSAGYAYFRSLEQPHISLCTELDISHLRRRVKERQLPFFLTLLHCVITAANSVPQLRQRLKGDQAVEFENCLSSHTLALPDGGYCYCNLDCQKPLEEFLPYGQRMTELALQQGSLEDDEAALGYYFVTSLPWFSFTALHLPVADRNDSNPRFSFGKYFTREGKTLLPLGIQVHHALVDGIHIAQFLSAVEQNIAAL